VGNTVAKDGDAGYVSEGGGKMMKYMDYPYEPDEEENDQIELDEDENGRTPGVCMGDPFTCPCETCQAFRIDLEADRANESKEGHDG